MYVCMYVENCSGLIRFVMCFRIYVCFFCENVLYDKIFSASIVLGCLYVCMYVFACLHVYGLTVGWILFLNSLGPAGY